MKKSVFVLSVILFAGSALADVTLKVEGALNQLKVDSIQKKLKDNLKSTTTVTMDAMASTLTFKGLIQESDAKSLVEAEGLKVK